MFNHLLFAIALMTFSLVSSAAATPMDASQAVADSTLAVLHKDVTTYQGGTDDKDVSVSQPLAPVAMSSAVKAKPLETNNWFAASSESSSLQPVIVLLGIIGVIVFFIARNSESAK